MRITVLSLTVGIVGFFVTVIVLGIGIKKKQDILKILGSVSAVITALSLFIAKVDIKAVEITPDISSIPVNTTVSFDSGIPFSKIYYTLDGSSPQKDGIKYEAPFLLDKEDIIADKFTIRYTARIGLIWLDSESKEYTVLPNSFTQNQDAVDEGIDTDNSNDNSEVIEEPSSNTDETEVTIMDNNKVLIPDNTEIVLKSASGYYLSRNENGNYYANKSEIDSSCVIKVVITNDGYTGFYNVYSGTYATAAIDKNPVVLCSTNTYMQSWECFTLYRDNDFITITSQGKERNNDEYKYVTSDEDDINRAIYVRAKDARAWEDFSIFIYSPEDKIWKNPFTSETILDNGCH